ncbi:probable plastid-lipid-associated protein 13, chloroplastic isoform X1 [Ananas comosus]|uniref:Probable plastid-lipid-associated protein 13, chloroplastic isoform X1 n=2 Tax=Ananas comosus TaxID=4615 RepID=A0A6P5EGP4_ANACO|nr:probable plastid-lipid-associated protein 13, chloroplastic isoform X1 [Ananas comosus]
MATVLGNAIFHPLLLTPPSVPFGESRRGVAAFGRRGLGGARWRAMVQQQQTFQGPAASYAREMERLSAKEALLLAFKDAGGFQSLVSGKTTEMQKIDINERIVGLERLNPTPRPTTSPFLEGRWNFEWFGAGSPGSFAARFLFERSPTTLAYLLGLDMLIKDGYSKVTANLKFLNTIESKFLLTTRLSVEGPMRMKEEYVEGLLETPTVSEQAIPEQLKSIVGQATGTLQQLPALIKDAFANGLKLPLNGTFQRFFMISYLDEEILIIRDSAGAPDVLTRLEGLLPSATAEPMISEYES